IRCCGGSTRGSVTRRWWGSVAGPAAAAAAERAARAAEHARRGGLTALGAQAPQGVALRAARGGGAGQRRLPILLPARRRAGAGGPHARLGRAAARLGGAASAVRLGGR